MKSRRPGTLSGGRGGKVSLPLWLSQGAALGLKEQLAKLYQAHHELLRAIKGGELSAESKARANLEAARKGARPLLGRDGMVARLAAVEATHEFLARERAGRTPDRHQFDLCYLCSPTVTLGLSRAKAMRYAAATFFQVENGRQPGGAFAARWNRWRAERGEPPAAWQAVAESVELRTDLREFLVPLVGSVCVDYPCRHLWRWQGVRFTREDVDKLAAAVLGEAAQHWLGMALD